MFENRLYINGNDAFLRYGVLLAQGGINDLIKYPTRKHIYTTIGLSKRALTLI